MFYTKGNQSSIVKWESINKHGEREDGGGGGGLGVEKLVVWKGLSNRNWCIVSVFCGLSLPTFIVFYSLYQQKRTISLTKVLKKYNYENLANVDIHFLLPDCYCFSLSKFKSVFFLRFIYQWLISLQKQQICHNTHNTLLDTER